MVPNTLKNYFVLFVLLIQVAFAQKSSVATKSILDAINLLEKGKPNYIPNSKGFRIVIRSPKDNEKGYKDTVFYRQVETNGLCVTECIVNLSLIDSVTYFLTTKGIGMGVYVEYRFKFVNMKWYLEEVLDASTEAD